MKMIRFFIALQILLLLFSCKNSNKLIVGYLVPNMVDERYLKEQEFFKSKISSLGGETLTASADYNDQTQIQQAREMIEQGARVLVINSVNMNTAAAIVRDAHEKGVKVVAYDRLIKNCDLDYYISFDNYMVGKLMAESIVKIKPDGNFILIGGDKADQNAVLVKKGQMDVLKNYEGKIKICYNIYVEDWANDNAYQELKRFLNLSGIIPDAILSSNDGMTSGCIAALKERDLAGKVLITGQDAELVACKNIINDLQTSTIYKPLKKLAEKAAETAYKMAAGEDVEKTTTADNGQISVPSFLLDPIVVDKNNIRNTVIADGFYTEAQIFN